MSMMVSFVLSFFPRDVLDEILNLIGSVSEGFPSYSLFTAILPNDGNVYSQSYAYFIYTSNLYLSTLQTSNRLSWNHSLFLHHLVIILWSLVHDL